MKAEMNLNPRRKRLLALSGLMILALQAPSFAQAPGMSVLKYPVGARANALAGAFSAQAQDASAVSWNPSALSRLSSSQVYFYHSQFVMNTSYDYAAYAHPFGSHKAA